MNIFFTSRSPYESAKNLCQRHIVKMILESAQMLSTAHRECNFTASSLDQLYKSTHKNHPSSVWVRTSKEHYVWLYDHFIYLCNLYTTNTGRIHATDTRLRCLLRISPPSLPCRGFTSPPACMPDDLKSDNICESYQKYLIRKYEEWQTRVKPINVSYPHGKPNWLKLSLTT